MRQPRPFPALRRGVLRLQEPGVGQYAALVLGGQGGQNVHQRPVQRKGIPLGQACGLRRGGRILQPLQPGRRAAQQRGQLFQPGLGNGFYNVVLIFVNRLLGGAELAGQILLRIALFLPELADALALGAGLFHESRLSAEDPR